MWYLIDRNGNFCKAWNFIITMITIYEMIVVPYILVFPDTYSYNKTLKTIELVVDIIYMVEICLNFIKKSRAHKDLK
jgi:hypothetical protein